jgi:crotonobetainyl-CoA:carnitine CoA-transferase CaiB-like acyl-CoA transferase
VRAANGWLAVAVQDQRQLTALSELLDGQELTTWAAERDAWPAAQQLQARGIAAGPVLDAESLLRDPQLKSRGFFEEVVIDQLGTHRPLIGRPYDWSAAATEVGIAGCAPSFGADNDYVLRELLGLDEERVRRLRADRVVVDRPVDPPPAMPLSLAGRRVARARAQELQHV